jgi:peptide-methionine (S)-S-oxide reductase
VSEAEAALATFAGGGFWGLEDAFRRREGVLNTAVGYCGGVAADPSYRDVATGTTGHVEAVQVQFDPRRVSFGELVELFFERHDPTKKMKPPGEVGSQFRSVIFVRDAAQELGAKSVLERISASARFKKPVLTVIERAAPFYRAEDYHQQYLEKRSLDR